MIESFLYNRCQRVVLNAQFSSWLSIRASVPQGSVLASLFLLIYINDLPEGLNSEVKHFTDETSLFSIANCVNTSASTLKYRTGHTSGKCHSAQIDLSKENKLFSPERKTQPHTHHIYYFTNILLFWYQLKNNYIQAKVYR